MLKWIRMGRGRIARMRSSTIFYAVKHGEHVVAVEHVLDVFSSSVTIAVKYNCIFGIISICTLACYHYLTNIACHLSSGTRFLVSHAKKKQSSRNCQTVFLYKSGHKRVFLFHFFLLASSIIRTIPEMLSYREIKLCSRLVLWKTLL